ncbi:MAG: hypothetical protein K6G12_03085 [Lachnospiraceae bacterium]|nr:hypothetical protein [Lachnospiraceae bacterium]
MNVFLSYGVIVGILVGIIIAIVLLKMANTDHKVKTEYDERQEAIRGKAYCYSFYTTVIYEVLMIMLSMAEIELPIEDYILHFGGIFAGCLVLCVYSIWHGVYWGLNNDHRRYMIVIAICIVLNMIPVIGIFRGNLFSENGKIGMPMLNVMVLIMLIVVCAELLIKKSMDKKNAEED